MMLGVTLRPQNSPAASLKLTDEPVFSENAMGGHDTASIRARLTDAQFRDALGAYVEIESPRGGNVFWGRVVNVDEGVLTAAGGMKALENKSRGVIYATMRNDRWLKLASEESSLFEADMVNATARMCQRPGTTAQSTDYILYGWWDGYYLKTLKYSVTVGHVDVKAGVCSMSTKLGGFGAVTYKTSTAANQSLALNGTYGFAIHCECELNNSAPSRADKYVNFYDMLLIGEPNLDPPYADAVLKDICGQLGTADLPSGAAYLEWIGTDATSMTPLEFSHGTRLAVQARHVANRRGRQFGFWGRWVSSIGQWWGVPVYQAWPTTTRYMIDATRPYVEDNLQGLGLADMVSRVVGTYSDADGIDQIVTATATSGAIVDADMHNDYALELGRCSAAVAQNLVNEALTILSENRRSGSVTVAGPILDMQTGAKVDPADIVSGELVQVQGLKSGTVTGRIRRVVKAGNLQATIGFDAHQDTQEAIDLLTAR